MQVVTEPALVVQSESFEAALAGGDRGALRTLCESRHVAAKAESEEGADSAPASGTAATPEDRETWAFLQTHFEADGRRYLLQQLGFADALPPEPVAEPSGGAAEGTDGGLAGAASSAAEGMAGLSLEQQAQVAAAAGALLPGDGADFFENPPEGACAGSGCVVPHPTSTLRAPPSLRLCLWGSCLPRLGRGATACLERLLDSGARPRARPTVQARPSSPALLHCSSTCSPSRAGGGCRGLPARLPACCLPPWRCRCRMLKLPAHLPASLLPPPVGLQMAQPSLTTCSLPTRCTRPQW